MIVRNEAAVIERCLKSVRPFISHWTISDTGSSDGTPEIIERFMAKAGIPGKLIRDEWVNFGHNRSLAMKHGQGTADYHLLLDADMVLRVHNSDSSPSHADGCCLGSTRLTEDAYLIRFEGATDYSVIRLVSDKHVWRYAGATHEYIYSDTAKPAVKLPGVSIAHFEDGGSRSDKYERDIRLLTEEYESLLARQSKEQPTDPGPTGGGGFNLAGNLGRTVFYLAQSYRDLKQFEKALEWYEKRALMGGWAEETWCALYQLGRIQQVLGCDWRVVLNSYLQAYNFRPWRLEPIYAIARFYREHQQWSLGYHFARLCTEVGYPEDILFVERPVYEYLLPYEYVICCLNTARREEAQRVMEILEREGNISEEMMRQLKVQWSDGESGAAGTSA